MYKEGQTATNPRTGVKIVFQGGEWHNAAGDADAPGVSSPASVKLTEDQGKAQTYARLMQGAERSYDSAVQQGYKPGSPRNALAAVAEGLPFGGLDGLGAVIRDPVGDRARQAELQWSDAQLKAVSGAASPEAEVKRNVRTYFPRPGESMRDIGPQKRTARQTAFEGAVVRSGPSGQAVPPYPRGDVPPAARATMQRLFAAGRIDTKQPHGTQANPFIVDTPEKADALPVGSYVITPEGHLGVVE